MERLALFIYRKRKILIWPLLGFLALGGIWWYRSSAVEDLRWQYVAPFKIRIPLRYAVHGIDVSHHNNRIDWQRVGGVQADGVALQFVFVKATEGATLVDRRFKSNWREARRAGLRRGAYHFYHPRRDPEKQAKNFIRTVTLQPGDFAPVLDFEKDGNVPAEKLIADLRAWLKITEEHYKVKPIIYTNGHFYLLYIAGNFDDYPLWLADYSTEHVGEYKSDRLYFWQHSKQGGVEGIRGNVDFNVFIHAPERLQEICL